MKRFAYVLFALFAAGTIASCGSARQDTDKDKTAEKIEVKKTAKDIQISDLRTACECVDAALLIWEEILDLAKEGDKIAGAREEDDAIKEKLEEIEKEMESLFIKMDEVGEYCDTIVEDDKEYEECKNYEKLEDLLREFDALYTFGW